MHERIHIKSLDAFNTTLEVQLRILKAVLRNVNKKKYKFRESS